MCLVSYIPTGPGSFLLNSNRDESPDRSPSFIKKETRGNVDIFYPADVRGGSWIAISNLGHTVCLLNGAFEAHTRTEPYRLSRGLMLKAYFDYSDPSFFLEEFDFWGIEPFTLIMAASSWLIEFRWDGLVKHIRNLPKSKSHIWSSCTLYSQSLQEERQGLFFSQLATLDDFTAEDLKNIHLSKTKLDVQNDFVMNRDDIVKTVSFSQMEVSPMGFRMMHQNLVQEGKIERIDSFL